MTCLKNYFFSDKTVFVVNALFFSPQLTKLIFSSLPVFMCDGFSLSFLRHRRWRPLQEDLSGPCLMIKNIISNCIYAQDDEIVV